MRLLLIFILSPFFLFSQTQIGNDIDGLAAGDNSGIVSFSDDGTIVAIGAPEANYVRVFENSAGDWEQLGNTILGDSPGDHFGSSVSLSSDGTILAIGSPDAEIAGYVRIFELNGSGVWTQIGDDLVGEADSGEFDNFSFGISVSLSDDGTILAIAEDRGGDPWEPQYGHPGFIHMFENSSGTWTQMGDIIYTNIPYLFKISLAGNGETVAGSGLGWWSWWFLGAASVYKNIAGNWVQVGNNFLGDWSNTIRGVSLSLDGSRIAIGGSTTKVYEYITNDWEQIGEDIEYENIYEGSGDLKLSNNGTVVALSGMDNTSSQTQFGFVRVYKSIAGAWIKAGIDIIGEGLGDYYHNVELSSDANKISIGSLTNDGNGVDSGHVRVFDLSAILSTDANTFVQFYLYPNPATNQFTIQLDAASELERINIYNNLGQLVHSTSKMIVDTSAFSSGLYYVEVITNKGKATEKLIIK